MDLAGESNLRRVDLKQLNSIKSNTSPPTMYLMRTKNGASIVSQTNILISQYMVMMYMFLIII